jgi:hypothetical protein
VKRALKSKSRTSHVSVESIATTPIKSAFHLGKVVHCSVLSVRGAHKDPGNRRRDGRSKFLLRNIIHSEFKQNIERGKENTENIWKT